MFSPCFIFNKRPIKDVLMVRLDDMQLFGALGASRSLASAARLLDLSIYKRAARQKRFGSRRPHREGSSDQKSRFQGDGIRQIVDVGRSGHYSVMDFGELLLGTVALDTNGVTQALVAVWHLRVDPKKTPEVDF